MFCVSLCVHSKVRVWLLKVFRFYLSLLVRMLRMAGSDVKSGLLRYRVPLPAGGLLRRTGR
jgi:hypothetical protein